MGSRSIHERLASRLTPTADGCIVIDGWRTPKGYGRISFNGRGRFAHRIAWELANGRAIPPGMIVMHTCDNPPCCNPGHLRLGTNADNTADMLAKGRHPSCHPRTHCINGHELTDDNAHWRSNGTKLCLTCRTCSREHAREACRRYRAKRAAA